MSDIADVEAAIRAAEEMMSRDLQLFRTSSPPPPAPKQEQSTHVPSPIPPSATESCSKGTDTKPRIKPTNRYNDPDSREQLIQELLNKKTGPQRTLSSSSLGDIANEVVNVADEKSDEEEKIDGEEGRYDTPTAREELVQRLLRHRETSEHLKAIQEANKGNTPKFRRKTLAELREEAERQASQTCTFKPKISKVARRRPREQREAMIDRLSKPRTKECASPSGLDDRPSDAEKKEFTFKPDVSKSKKSLSRQNKRDIGLWQERLEDVYRSNVPVEERLHLDASERFAAREKARRELEDAELKQQSFRPQVNEVSEQIARNLNYQPIQERAAEVQREKQVRLARIKYEADLENVDLTFQPQISDISQKLARKKVLRKGDPEALDVTNRLLKDAEDLKLQKKIREKQLLTEQQLQCKFQPTVSSKSKQLLQNNPLFQKEFVERQKVLSKARRRCASDEEQKNFTFKPNIGKSYNRVLKPARLLESEAERYQRLAHTERRKQEDIRRSISEQHYAQFTYQPKINPISRALAGEGSRVEELYKNTKMRFSRESAIKQAEASQAAECTFKPETNDIEVANRQLVFADAENLVHNIERRREVRERVLDHKRRALEYEELKECTFTPAVNKAAPPSSKAGSTKPIIIRGLGRHLELKERKKRMAEEQRRREEKAFLLTVSEPKDLYTVPKPFNLSTSNRRRQNATRTEQNEFTFEPATLSKARRQEIREILARES